MNQNLKTIVDTLSDQIQCDLAVIASEEHYPRHSADESEAKIKALKSRVQELRDLRNAAEIVFTQVPR